MDIYVNPPRAISSLRDSTEISDHSSTFVNGPARIRNNVDLFADLVFVAVLSCNWSFSTYREKNAFKNSDFRQSYGGSKLSGPDWPKLCTSKTMIIRREGS